MKRNALTTKRDAKVVRPLTREEYRSITGGLAAEEAAGLLAFPFIQTAMQGSLGLSQGLPETSPSKS